MRISQTSQVQMNNTRKSEDAKEDAEAVGSARTVDRQGEVVRWFAYNTCGQNQNSPHS